MSCTSMVEFIIIREAAIDSEVNGGPAEAWAEITKHGTCHSSEIVP